MTDQCLIYRSGGCLHALALGHVVEIMRPLPIDASSARPPLIGGTSVIRGRPSAVIDLAPLGRTGPVVPTRMVSIRAGEESFALLADEVIGVQSLAAALVQASMPLLAGLESELDAAVKGLDAGLQRVLQTVRAIPEAAWGAPAPEEGT